MKLKTKLLAACLLFFSSGLFAQCLTAPIFPDCTGTEPLVIANDNIAVSQTKYFYGISTTLSNVRISGGTLVVCGDLTLNELAFDSGAIYIRPGATLIVNNASGLIVKGNTAIYNAGIFQCLGNYVMDGAYATTLKPNIFINTSLSSWLKMQNQYFVINNSFSKIVNNGLADFHGLITDPLAAAGSVCLGNKSQTRMTVLYNKAKYPYVAPGGTACVSVSQYSQFYDTLTIYPNINFCLSAMHTSDASCIAWGCKPNAWGAGQVSNGCTNCASLINPLTLNFKTVEAIAFPAFNEITWEMSDLPEKIFYVQRSLDGVNFITIDSVKSDLKSAYHYQDTKFDEVDFYRVVCQNNNQQSSSKIVEVKRPTIFSEVYPNPFTSQLMISLRSAPAKFFVIKVTDIYGRKIIPGEFIINGKNVYLHFPIIARGMYLITVLNGMEKQVFKAVKE